MPGPRGFRLQLQRLIWRDVPELDKVAPLVLELHTSAVAAGQGKETWQADAEAQQTVRGSAHECQQ